MDATPGGLRAPYSVSGARSHSERGRRTSSLQATKGGYPVYARLGYEPICAIEMWERRK